MIMKTCIPKTMRYKEQKGYEDVLSVYFELLRTGIRDLCMPNIGVFKNERLNFINKKAEKQGFHALMVKTPVVMRDSKGKGRVLKGKFHYQRIIYVKEAKQKAATLRFLLQKTPKTQNVIRRIGELFGYRKDKINEFIKQKRANHEIQ